MRQFLPPSPLSPLPSPIPSPLSPLSSLLSPLPCPLPLSPPLLLYSSTPLLSSPLLFFFNITRYGSLMGTPIINPPQSAILGMHGIFKRAVVVNDQIVIRPMMTVALTYLLPSILPSPPLPSPPSWSFLLYFS